MGRNSSDHSESPVRNHRSSRRSPSRRDRSPAQHRSSHSARSPGREKPPSRTKSPRRAKSPTTRSPVRDKPSSQSRSSKHTRSKSPLDRLPVKEAPSTRTRSPVKANTKSPGSRSPSPRSKRLRRDRSNNHKDDKSSERGRDKDHGKTRSPVPRNSRSPESRSPSPRTRRLRRAEADKADKIGDRDRRKQRDPERDETIIERRDRKSEDNGSSKSRHVSSASHAEHHRSRQHRSRSPSAATGARDEGNNSKEDDHRNGDDDSVARMKAAAEALETKEKQKPSFELSGKLAAETNRVKGVTLLFTEPPDARKPEIRWRLYVFKGGEVLNEPLYVHRQTCYLFGRERRVADIPTDHPSCSKQHAVLQYRQVEKEQPDGMLKNEIRPYIMDLGSTNGTFLNENRIEAERYYELMEKDTLKFGNSSREYVLLHENSAG